MRQVLVTDLGRMAYEPAWELQRALVEAKKEGDGDDRLLLVEHDPVITLGRRARSEHLLAGRDRLAAMGIALYAVERGGDVTYHGPGQLVAYPILDLRHFRRDVRWFAGGLMRCVVEALREFGIAADAREGRETGVWAAATGDGGHSAKIAAMGVRIERWITYHGIALNVCPDLAAFDLIVPCGLAGSRVTSMAAVLDRDLTVDEVRPAFVRAFSAAFGIQPVTALPGTLGVAA
jgi:lipoate-protein ligase B